MKHLIPSRNWLSSLNQPSAVPTGTVTEILHESSRKGGVIAQWKIRKSVNSAHVALANEAVQAMLQNATEVLRHRAALELDQTKKRAIAESLTETAVIEKAIVEMTNQVFHELDAMVHANHLVIYSREQARIDELAKLVAAGQMSEQRLDDACERLRARVADHLVRVEGMAERLIDNMGERWRRTLNNAQGNTEI